MKITESNKGNKIMKAYWSSHCTIDGIVKLFQNAYTELTVVLWLIDFIFCRYNKGSKFLCSYNMNAFHICRLLCCTKKPCNIISNVALLPPSPTYTFEKVFPNANQYRFVYLATRRNDVPKHILERIQVWFVHFWQFWWT